MAFYGRNGEGYPDPTASAAIGKFAQKKKERNATKGEKNNARKIVCFVSRQKG